MTQPEPVQSVEENHVPSGEVIPAPGEIGVKVMEEAVRLIFPPDIVNRGKVSSVRTGCAGTYTDKKFTIVVNQNLSAKPFKAFIKGERRGLENPNWSCKAFVCACLIAISFIAFDIPTQSIIEPEKAFKSAVL